MYRKIHCFFLHFGIRFTGTLKKEYRLKILTAHFNYQRKEVKMIVEISAEELLLIIVIVLLNQVL